ncbi:D-alanine--D-alanine ligase [Corynebacterium godavarianum]|uniref:D-alanine--D-alanine ligase n=1 Tax=Corynebacterium godavarianum TaxID=2054421 RepID=A0ABY3E6C6_9CORY|nr:D-alanine--D-alanine ligase family protein [Corynebacterium godavarianum]MBL7285797.1 D-alanine--D-alanine ligase [Corynebacterium godavarianum]TSJ75374.1 D-alanine--D-alanine ligase [Corynebacterium godavarianum]
MIRIAVIYGGQSTEHSISCISAGAVMAHLSSERYEIYPVGITRSGAWVEGALDPVAGATLPEVSGKREVALSLNPDRRGVFVDAASGEALAQVDVVFPVLHGKFGEDGTIQGLLEMAGVPYVGPGVLASACGMDKEYTKKLVRAEGVAVAEEVVLRAGQTLDDAQRARLGLPVFVKPASGGSSIGVSKVESWEALDEAIALAHESDGKVLVESELHGDEVEVGVIEHPDGRIEASVPARLNGTEDSAEGFYGFETKYLDNEVTATIPAPYDEATIAELKRLALRCFEALDCKSLARIDFFVTKDGPVLNEINTMPGFTPISMYPQVWQASGLAYPDLLDLLVTTARKR